MLALSCDSSPKKQSQRAHDTSADSTVPAVESDPITPDVPDTVEAGGFTLQGRVLDDETGAPVSQTLCIDAVDQHEFALGIEPSSIAASTSAGDGTFTLTELPIVNTTGLVLRVTECNEQVSTWQPTMTLISAEVFAGLGASDTVDGQVVWIVSSERAAQIDAALQESGSPTTLTEAGILMGQIFDTEGEPLALAAIRGPDSTRVHYDQGAEIWLPYVNTTSEGAARFASPGAPWALWTCRAQAFNIPPVLAGARPGWVTHWDFRATEDFRSD